MPVRSLRRSLAHAPRAIRAALLLAIAGGLTGGLGGCVSNGNSGPSNAYAKMDAGNSVAFDSIDGPPPQVFDRLVSMLDSEAKLRNVAVVSRQGQATYRVRSYLAAQIRGGKTTIAWVWDVYDQNQQRALRLSGEEPAGKAGRDAGRDAWAQADELVLRRIAQAGLTGLGSALNGGPAEPAPTRSGPAIAAADAETGAPTLSYAAASFSPR